VARRKRKQAEPTGVAPLTHLKGLAFALVLTAIFVIIATLLLSVTSLTEIWARWLVVLGGAVAILAASYRVGASMGKAGLINGGVTGLIYVLAILILALLLDMGLSARSLITLVIGFVLGGFGGVMGVNNR